MRSYSSATHPDIPPHERPHVPVPDALQNAGPVLITGGAGFIGRELAGAFAAASVAVTVLDDLSAPASTFDHASLRHPCIRLVEGSTADLGLVADLVAAHPVVVHFASVVGVEATIRGPVPTIENLVGTTAVTASLTPEHVALFGSSADVYGLHSRVHGGAPMHEDDLVVYEAADVARWTYARVKGLEEHLFARSPARCVTARIFNCYGPGMDAGAPRRLVPQFLDALRRRTPLRISGDGSQRRALCYYTDTLRGLLLALAFATEQHTPFYSAINIGSADARSVHAIAEALVDAALATGAIHERPPVEFGATLYSRPFDDGWHRVPDLARARDLLGYVPEVDLEDGLRRLVAAEWA